MTGSLDISCCKDVEKAATEIKLEIQVAEGNVFILFTKCTQQDANPSAQMKA